MVRGLHGCLALMRATKIAIADALRTDPAVSDLVPAAQVFAVERATLPTLPSIELVGVSSERIGNGPMIRHAINVEVTASDPTEDGADLALDAIVRAVRQRLGAAEDSTGRPDCTGDRRRRAGRATGLTVEHQRKRPSVRDTRRKRERQCRGRRVSTAIWVPPGRVKARGPRGWMGTRANVTLSQS